MSRIYRILVESCWGLGVLSTLVAVALKLVPTWAEMVRTTPRGGDSFSPGSFSSVCWRPERWSACSRPRPNTPTPARQPAGDNSRLLSDAMDTVGWVIILTGLVFGRSKAL